MVMRVMMVYEIRQHMYQRMNQSLIHRAELLLLSMKKQNKMEENLRVGIEPFSFAQLG